jgi:hypothetical protein
MDRRSVEAICHCRSEAGSNRKPHGRSGCAATGSGRRRAPLFTVQCSIRSRNQQPPAKAQAQPGGRLLLLLFVLFLLFNNNNHPGPALGSSLLYMC